MSVHRMIVRAIAALAILAAGAAWAQEAPADGRRLLAERIASFESALEKGDHRSVVSVVPPRVLSHLAEQGGLTVEDLVDQLVELTARTMNDTEIEHARMNLDAASLEVNGKGRSYALIPTEVRLVLEGGRKVVTTSRTVAVWDDGRWYLLRIADPGQAGVLRAVYPGFEGVEIPRGTMELQEDGAR